MSGDLVEGAGGRTFEGIKHVNEHGAEYWNARELQPLLGYGQWYFSVVDIIGALTDSPNPRDYWYRMKRREQEACGVELSTFCRQLKPTSADGKAQSTEADNTESGSPPAPAFLHFVER